MTTTPAEELVTRGPPETWAFAGRLAERLGPGSVVALHGPLGSGKTCLVQGLGRALGVAGPVSSPTFTLVNEYRGPLPLYHFDLYRLERPAEILALEWDEYLDGDGVTVVEWAERAAGLLPPRTVHVHLEMGRAPEERRLRVWTGEA